jgi:hypothetical protein
VEEPASRDITRQQIIIGIVSSLIATVFFLLIMQPLLGLLWRFVLSNVGLINDIACRGAALDNTERYSFMLWAILSSTVIVVLAGPLLFRGLIEGRSVTLRPEKLSNFSDKLWHLLILIVPLLCLFLVSAQYESFLEMALKTSFNQRLTVLTPKISDQERKELLAEWASMRTETDYIHIVDEMEQKAKASGITLPKFRTGAAPAR